MPRKRIAIDFRPVSPRLVFFSRDPQWALQYLHSFILKIYIGYFYFFLLFFGSSLKARIASLQFAPHSRAWHVGWLKQMHGQLT